MTKDEFKSLCAQLATKLHEAAMLTAELNMPDSTARLIRMAQFAEERSK